MVCKDPGTLELLELGDTLKERYRQQSGYTPSAFLLNSLHLANRCELDYRFAKHKRLHVELALLRMCYLPYATEGKALASEAARNPEKKNSGESNPPSGSNSTIEPEAVFDDVSRVEEPVEDKPVTTEQADSGAIAQPESRPENQQTEEIAARKTGGRRARSSLLLQHEEKPGINQEPGTESGHSGNGSDRISDLQAELVPEVVMEAWTHLADHMESSKSESLGNAIRQYQPVVSGQEIRFTVGNKVLHEMAVEAKMSMVSFLNKHLPAGFVLLIDYDTSLVEGGIPDRPLTEREKHEELQKKYPNLRDLESQLGLDLEY
jgi:DNA polymerase III subunit gamma/tau